MNNENKINEEEKNEDMNNENKINEEENNEDISERDSRQIYQ